MNIAIKQALNNNKMTPFQIVVITLCVVMSMIDGFDVLSVAFIAPTLSGEWFLSAKQLGVLFSTGLVGMVLGAVLISPLADKLGRRKMILLCLVILSAGMMSSSQANSFNLLLALRFFTGLGMGALMPALNTMVAEYASIRRRSFVICIMTTGYTVGTIIGGLSAIYLIEHWGWRAVFFVGGSASLVMIPIVLALLPESVDFLLSRRPSNALNMLNKLCKKLAVPTYSELPDCGSKQDNLVSSNGFLLSGLLNKAILLCLTCFMLMCSFYFIVNWIPKLLNSFGFSTKLSIQSSVIMSLGGIAGSLCLGWFAQFYSVYRLTAFMLFSAFVAVVVFPFAISLQLVIFILLVIIGFVLNAAMGGLYAILPDVFPADIRSTGTGIVFGLGRTGAAAGPYIAGLLIGSGVAKELYFFYLALPLLLATLMVLLVKRA